MQQNYPISWIFESVIDSSREAQIEQRLSSSNQSLCAQWSQNHDGLFVASPLHIFVSDESGNLIGGIIGRTHAIREWLEVLVLWVEEGHRRVGLGKTLMQKAEEEAQARGCLYARLATSDYQAPEFYYAIGYDLYGKLENCPPGNTVFYFHKTLTNPRSST